MAIRAYNEMDSAKYLSENGIPVVKSVVLTEGSDIELSDVSEKLGFPLVMKILSDDILHKTDAGCVKLNIVSTDEMKLAYAEIIANAKAYKPDAVIQGVVCEQMIPTGLEALIGVSTDPQFGQVVMVGLGGVLVELLKAVSMRVIPVSKHDAEEMIDETPLGIACNGYRGSTYNKDELVDLILRVSDMVERDPAIREVDINPLMIYGDGRNAVAVDAVVIREVEE